MELAGAPKKTFQAQQVQIGIENGDAEPGRILNPSPPQATLDTITDSILYHTQPIFSVLGQIYSTLFGCFILVLIAFHFIATTRHMYLKYQKAGCSPMMCFTLCGGLWNFFCIPKHVFVGSQKVVIAKAKSNLTPTDLQDMVTTNQAN